MHGLTRSIFISVFTAYVLAALIFSLLQLVQGTAPLMSWFGMCLAALAPVAFISWLYLAGRGRTSRHPVAISTVCGLGTAITMTANWRYGDASGSAHLWAGLCLLGWFIYLRWYSVFRHRTSKALIPGAELPDFTLLSLQGETIGSGSFRGKNLVLIFYRGNWCPLCSAQITELAEQYRNLQALNTEVVLVSSQPMGHSQQLANKFSAPMRFLHDENNTAAEQLGIKSRFGTPMGMQVFGYGNDTALPTVIITDTKGKILFVDQTDNYRVRPEPELYLRVLRKNEPI